MILPFCLCGSMRWGHPQCPSVLVRNGHRHRCCSMTSHPGQHFSHCYAPVCVAEWVARLPPALPTAGLAVAAISLTWAEAEPTQEQAPLLIPWHWPEPPRLA